MKYFIHIILAYCISVLLSAPAYAGKVEHLNIAAFQKVNSSYEFELGVQGRFSDFIAEMEKGAQVIFLTHTAGVKDEDVITLSESVLREGSNSEFEDNGVNCSFSFSKNQDGDDASYSISGLCSLLLNVSGKEEQVKMLIPSADLPDTSTGNDVWMMIYEDKQKGVAFYANISSQ